MVAQTIGRSSRSLANEGVERGIVREPAHRVVDRRELQLPEGVLERGDAGTAEPARKAGPDAGGVAQLAQIPDDLAFVRVQGDVETPLTELASGSQVLQARALLAKCQPQVVAVTEPQPVRQRPPDEPFRPVGLLDRVWGQVADPAGRFRIAVVKDDERA